MATFLSRLFSRKPKLDLNLLSEPRATKELNRALIEIERATEYVQSWLAVMDADIAERVSKRARVANALATSLAHKLDAPEPEVLSDTHFRTDLVAAAKAMASEKAASSPYRSETLRITPRPGPTLFDTQAAALEAASKPKPDA